MNLDRRAVAAPTRELADWIASLRYEDLPSRTREVVRISLLDTLGCGVYGYCMPWSQKVLAWARRSPPARGTARVWGEAERSLRAADAALVNGTAAHAFELDDYHNTKLHPGAVVVPAAIAVAEELNSTGAELITAIAAGYEIIMRTSLALNPAATRMRGWHLTGVCGPLAAAAACASLMKLDAEQTTSALGLGGTQGGGLWAFAADGAMTMRLHAGKAAQAGVFAAELAQLGFIGPTQVYEHPDGGLLKAFSDASDAALLTRDLGSVYHLDRTCIKPYPCCGSLLSYVDAAFALRSKLGVPWDRRLPVRAGIAKVVDAQCGYDYVPSNALNAQMSLRYVVAAALIDGEVVPAQFSGARLEDPALVGLARDIEVIADAELDRLYPKAYAGWVAAEHNGKWERVYVENPTGSVHAPIDAAGITAKFRGINPGLPADKIAAVALSMEQHSVSELLGLLA